MQDGSAPGKSVTIERFCYGRTGSTIASNAGKTGHYLYNANVDALAAENCGLRAVMQGYDSTIVRISHLNPWSDPNLPDIILRVRDASLGEKNSLTKSDLYFESSSIPPNARQPWSNAVQARAKNNWAVGRTRDSGGGEGSSEDGGCLEVSGEMTERQNNYAAAAEAYEMAVNLDPKLVDARLGLLWSYVQLKKWPEVEAAADALIEQKADVKYPEIYTHRAIARFNRSDLAGAESSVMEGIRRDTKHQLPRSEMVLGAILEARGDTDGARQHMQRYLELDPRATDAATIRERINNVGKVAVVALAPTLGEINPTVDASGEAWSLVE